MKIEKRGEGSYRVRKMYKGQMHTVTFDHKPTQKEAITAMGKELEKVHQKNKVMNFKTAAEKYIASKHNVLSPSTVQGYEVIIRNLSKDFLEKNVHDITAMDVQTEINKMSGKHSPKTVRNRHGFISAVLGAFNPNLKISPLCRKRSKMSRISPLTRM